MNIRACALKLVLSKMLTRKRRQGVDDGSPNGGLPPPQLMHPRAMGGHLSMGPGGMGPNGMGPGLQGMSMLPQSVPACA